MDLDIILPWALFVHRTLYLSRDVGHEEGRGETFQDSIITDDEKSL